MTQHPQQPAAADTETPTTRTDRAPGPLRTPSRWWSRRRIPAAIVALVLSAACGALLFDTVRVRTGHTAGAWRKSLTHELSTRPLNDPWIITGAAVAVVLGLWLLVIAFTPGHRRLLPLTAPDTDVDVMLDRAGAALLLRDAALRTPGVSEARIRVRRRHVTARTQIRFRDAETVENELTETLEQQISDLGLASSPRLTVRVRPGKT
ncbi:DUF6286 domain-containing protein [Kitasatospora herbaricolor]|uniref:Alkaline shock response membrane anchor protein AmaP n=1 Tax=Kitasatospora herbaricolor TaxID=68217 RepID=A0ABZ1WI30_9ACTN|nr:DUF6286 domain-containing protein [Kitasatospora herbaricolor]